MAHRWRVQLGLVVEAKTSHNRSVVRNQGLLRHACVASMLASAVTSWTANTWAEGAAPVAEPAPEALEGLLLDLERIVYSEESGGWFVDRTALDNIHSVVMESACRVDTSVRERAIIALDREQQERGDPYELFVARNRQLDDDVERAMETWRKRAALREAHRLAGEECPFWVTPSHDFRGWQTNRDRFVLALETGGVAQVRSSEGSLTIGGGGAGRLLVGLGFKAPITLLGGLEFGGGAMLEPNTQPTQFVVNYFPAVPLLIRFHDVSWHYDLEAGPVSHFQANDLRLSYGLRGGFAIGVSALRTRGFIPWAGVALAYDYYFESGGRPTAHFVRGGLRVGGTYGP